MWSSSAVYIVRGTSLVDLDIGAVHVYAVSYSSPDPEYIQDQSEDVISSLRL